MDTKDKLSHAIDQQSRYIDEVMASLDDPRLGTLSFGQYQVLSEIKVILTLAQALTSTIHVLSKEFNSEVISGR